VDNEIVAASAAVTAQCEPVPVDSTTAGAQNAWDEGPVHHPAHDGATFLPNDRVIQLIKDHDPHTALATAWYSSHDTDGINNNWQISDEPNPQALLLDTWAVTR
jgi:hypothetical protein